MNDKNDYFEDPPMPIRGTVVKDPELTFFGAKNTPSVKVSLAVTRGKGQYQHTHYRNCKAIGHQAICIADNWRKGDRVRADALDDTEAWTDKTTGQKRTKPIWFIVDVAKKCWPKSNGHANARTTDPVSEDEPPDPEDTPF